MPLISSIRVADKSTTTGTASYVVAAGTDRTRRFSSALADGERCEYMAQDGSYFEHGVGTWTAGTGTLSRDIVLSSSSGAAKDAAGRIVWGAGTRDLFIVQSEGAVNRHVRNTAQTLTVADYGRVLALTSGAATNITHTLPAGTAVFEGWSVTVSNESGTSSPGLVKVQRAGANTIDADGATIVRIPAGTACTFVWDGSAWRTLGRVRPGSVIQEAVAFDAGGSTSSTTFVNINGAYAALTPRSDTSTIVVEAILQATVTAVSGVNNKGSYSLNDTAVPLGNIFAAQVNSGAGNLGVVVPVSLAATVSNAGLAARTFGVSARTDSASGAVSGSNIVLKLKEVML